jgi:antibiotic biosynthesis monooxygenase (ABM) superfamily enzyme
MNFKISALKSEIFIKFNSKFESVIKSYPGYVCTYVFEFFDQLATVSLFINRPSPDKLEEFLIKH